jgi:hypothetical protein
MRNLLAAAFLLGFYCAAFGQERKPPAAENGTKPETHEIKQGDNKATIDVPKHALVKIDAKPDWLFYSIQAGYGQPEEGAYTPVPAEMTFKFVEGTLDDAVAYCRKTDVGNQREIVREVKRDGQVVMLVKDKGSDNDLQTLRAFQFVPATGAVLVIDATSCVVRGMPAKNKKQITDLLMTGLKSIKLGEKSVKTMEAQRYLSGTAAGSR